MSSNRTVHVIDDDDAMRDSMSFLLEARGFAPQAYASADAFLDSVAQAQAGYIVTDVRMPGLSGLELLRELKSRGVSWPVIVMTGHGDIGLAVQAMKAGAIDFIEKPFSDEALLNALSAAQDKPGAETREADADAAQRLLASLSPRERDVLQGVVAGKANKVIAHDLSISPRTVEIYRANLMTKTGARHLSELMRIAMAAGL